MKNSKKIKSKKIVSKKLTKKNAKPLLNKKMLIAEVAENYPEATHVLTDMGLHCIGCHISPFESIEEGASGHGMTQKDIDKAMKKMNKIIEEENKK